VAHERRYFEVVDGEKKQMRRKVTDSQIQEFTLLYKKGVSTCKIGIKFGIDATTVQYWLHKTGVKTKSGGRYSNEIKRTGLTLEKAYILGVVGPGDGFMMYAPNNHCIGLRVVDQDFADYFKTCLENTYGLSCRQSVEITKHQPVIKTFLHSKAACNDLLSHVKSIGDFKEKSWVIPNIIFNASRRIKAQYVKGFSDSQGCIYSNRLKRDIYLSSCNLIGLKQMQILLSNLGLRSGIRSNKKALRISGKINLTIFKDLVGFTIERKQSKLEYVLSSFKNDMRRRYRPSAEVAILTPKFSKLRVQGLTYKEIAERCDVDMTTVHKRLNYYG